NLQLNFEMSQNNVNEAFLKIQQLERENADLRAQVENFGELEKSLSILQKEIVRRNSEMNARINESFKMKSQIAELESKVFELNNLRTQLDEARAIIADYEQNTPLKKSPNEAEFEAIIAAQQETIDAFSRQILALRQGASVGDDAFKNTAATLNFQQGPAAPQFDQQQFDEAVDAVRQEEEKLRDEYEMIMVRQQEALDQYAENLVKAERENAEKDEFLKGMQLRVAELEEILAQQKDAITALQMEAEILKEQEASQAAAQDGTEALTIMLQDLSEQKQRAEHERNEIAEELLKTRQMFALAQQQIQDLQKIEDEYARMQSEHSELRGRVDELQNSQKKNNDVTEAIAALQEKVAELSQRFTVEETPQARQEFLQEDSYPEFIIMSEEILQEEIIAPREEATLPEDLPFKKPETAEPQPETEETGMLEPEITETEPQKPFKKQPEQKPRRMPREAAKEKPAANPAKDVIVDRMAALLERLEKSIQ
ncbi:MAG TPA: hypothetical protein VEC36_02055, partial [Patescibacteria group bacterium]|nr:hypothetical protein [Patescibacteria group bacterium]